MFGEKYDATVRGGGRARCCRWNLCGGTTWPTPPSIGLFKSPAKAAWPQASAGSKRWAGPALLPYLKAREQVVRDLGDVVFKAQPARLWSG